MSNESPLYRVFMNECKEEKTVLACYHLATISKVRNLIH